MIPGFFNQSMIEIPATTRFAFVHMDCDYYESTIQVLLYLRTFKMFSDGCALYFDDWYCNRGSPKFGQQAAWNKDRHNFNYTDWGPYGIVGHRFIIHTDVP